ncbi:hypothetical protein EV363DRAFT_510622 [Boletus edulis]|nr:hypothetical protein EV363DRAFT_510622 [Boletus edulis]
MWDAWYTLPMLARPLESSRYLILPSTRCLKRNESVCVFTPRAGLTGVPEFSYVKRSSEHDHCLCPLSLFIVSVGCACSPLGSYSPGVVKHARFTRWDFCDGRPLGSFISCFTSPSKRCLGLLGAFQGLQSSGVVSKPYFVFYAQQCVRV